MGEKLPKFEHTEIRMPDERITMSGLILPSSLQLKGPENYLQWKQVMLRNISAAGLVKYLRKDKLGPTIDVTKWESIADSELEGVSDWVRGNTKTANAIIYNCDDAARNIVMNYNNASEMWRALEQAYEGTGIVL
ncbi:hypothetical protein K3495_g13291 [Podosphaera aphanis]|nr:hypothetical protein K3495_g13291 [Podosphaera aphanis]